MRSGRPARIQRQESIHPDDYSDMLPHRGMHLMVEWNPSASMLRRLKSILISRVEAYISCYCSWCL